MTTSDARLSSVHLWRCTHELCGRVVEAGELGYLRHTYREDEAVEAATRLQHRDDPPKCIGRPNFNGSYTSHRASPMELVEFAPVDA
jgi:hypothetical protein